MFSNREKEVLELLMQGLSSKEIATQLFLSEETVSNHRKNMLRKANVKNVAQLIAYHLREKKGKQPPERPTDPSAISAN